MKKIKTKKIFALFCAFVVFATSVSNWNLFRTVEAAGNSGTGDSYITLPGFDTITTSDFEDSSRTLMQNKRYEADAEFWMKEHTSYDKKLLSLNVKFEATGTANRIEFGGKDGNAYFYVYPLTTSQLVLTQYGSMAPDDPFTRLYIENTGITSTINEAYNLQISMEYKDTNGDNATDSVKLVFYLNSVEVAKKEVANCNMDKFGNRLMVRVTGASPITVGAVGDVEGDELPYKEVEGFDLISTKDFETSSEEAMENKRYEADAEFWMKGHTSFDKKLLSLNVKFEATGTANRIEFGGKDGNAYFYVYPLTTSQLVLTQYGSMAPDDPFTRLYIENTGITSTINEVYNLQISMEYKDTNGDNATDSVKLVFYLNSVEVAKKEVANCNMDKFGNRLMVRVTGASPITVGAVGDVEGDELPYKEVEGFDLISTKDFETSSEEAMENKRYEADAEFWMKGHTSFDKKLLSLNVKFEATGTANRIEFGGKDGNAYFYVYPLTTSQLVLTQYGSMAPDDPFTRLYIENTGITSTINEAYNLQISMEYKDTNGDNATDSVKLVFYLNSVEVATKEVANCNMDKFGNRLMVRVTGASPITVGAVGDVEGDDQGGGNNQGGSGDQGGGDQNDNNQGGGNQGGEGEGTSKEPIESLEGFTTISVGNFEDADGNELQGKIHMSTSVYSLKNLDSFNKTFLSFKTTYTTGAGSRIEFAGKDSTSAFILHPNAEGSKLILTQSDWNATTRLAEDPYTVFSAESVGVDSFLNEELIIQISIEYGDFDTDGSADDMKLGFYFNGQQYLLADGVTHRVVTNCNMGNFGDVLTIYSDGNPIAVYGIQDKTGETIELPDLTGPLSEDVKKITLAHFGIEDGTYEHDPGNGFAVQGKTTTSLEKTAIAGDMLLKKDGKYLISACGAGGYKGLYMEINPTGAFTAHWYDKDGNYKSFVGRGTMPMGEWFNVMFSTEVMDLDGDGAKDDVKLGIWVDGKLMNDKYYPAIDCAQDLGNFFGVHCTEGYTVSLCSVEKLIEPFDYSVYGLTAEWENTLLNTGLTAEIPVGGSKESGPFSGDFMSIVTPIMIMGISLAGFILSGYVRRKQNEK